MTCKAFKDPALDVLYWQIPSLANLLMCMPRNLWSLNNEEPIVLSFCRTMLRADWIVLQSYALRLRSIYADEPVKMLVDSDALSAVSHYSGTNLLPNLRELRLYHESTCDDLLLRNIVHVPQIYLAPRVTTLSLSNLSSKSLHVLSVAIQRYPLLKTIRLAIRDAVGDELLEMLEGVDTLKSLCSFELVLEDKYTFPLSRMLEALGTLSHLDDILLECSNIDLALPPTFLTSDDNAPAFPALAALYLFSNARQIVHIMHYMRKLPSLTDIFVRFTDLIEDTSVPQAIEALTKALSAAESPIQGIDISFPETGDYSDLVSFHALRPLFRFQQLRSFHLTCFPPPSLDDAMLTELARGLRKLHTLELQWKADAQTNSRPKVTFTGLRALLRHCPNLQHLSLAVDTTVPCNDDYSHTAPSVDDVCHSELKTWEVGDSLIGNADVQRVAITLATWTPHLQDIAVTAEKSSSLTSKAYNARTKAWKQ
ncbi:hypothetical protein CONPUDRAFT_166514, partial [Coniophora puteana RWD-64-598 SS2]